MNDAVTPRWLEGNRRYLMESIAGLGLLLECFTKGAPPPQDVGTRPAAPQDLPMPPAIETLCAAFGLSDFERDVLLLCAGVELSDDFAARCAAAARTPTGPRPSFALALAAFPEAHWSAVTPAAPLRHYRLIEVLSTEELTRSRLRIDERVLHYLVGVSYVDERLLGLTRLVSPPQPLPPSYATVVERILRLWAARERERPIIQLCGSDPGAAAAIAAVAAAAWGLDLRVMRAADLPTTLTDREHYRRLWEREILLGAGALLIEYEGAEAARSAFAWAEFLPGLRFLAGAEQGRLEPHTVVRIDVETIPAHEQRELWQGRLGPLADALNGHLDALVAHYCFSAPGIAAASARACEEAAAGEAPPRALWQACRLQVRPAMDDLARRIEAIAEWDDLILPAGQKETLREIAMQVRQRAKVYGTWGFGKTSSRGLGITALFAGLSGTGKTMAAEVLARELMLDLYRVDLSQVVSKYIGETEKNLRRVFDAAEQGGVLLLFDEADALFGKRSEVKDSHDRYANIEVSYLLSRMETYRGLSVLTTNQKSALDPAFLRRIRFFVQFPFPDPGERAEIWRRIFPPTTPTRGLNLQQLARLNVAGGNIRNIALTAAFLAAEADEPVQMKHLAAAAVRECAKIERPLSEAEIGGWV